MLLLSPIAVSAAAPSIFNIWQGTEQSDPTGLVSGVGTCNVIGYCTFCHSIVVTRNIINLLVNFSAALSIALIVWGALKIITSSGKPQLLQEGRKTIMSAVVGLLIVLGAWVIVNTLLHIIVGEVSFPWSQIQCF